MLPVVMIFNSVFICLSLMFIIMSNDLVMLITPVHRKKGFVMKNGCRHAQNPSLNNFYRVMIACIIDFRIMSKRLCSEIL